nr:SHOCT domain-containing protein [Schaalia hyovaginalis]
MTPPQPTPVPASAPTPAIPDVAEQLSKLGHLRDAGILTEEEFATKKADLLSRL